MPSPRSIVSAPSSQSPAAAPATGADTPEPLRAPTRARARARGDARAPGAAFAQAEEVALARAEQAAAEHAGGLLLVAGVPGSGRTACLAARLAALRARGTGPEAVLALGARPASAAALARRLALGRGPAIADQPVLTPVQLCAALLRDEGVLVGVEPFFVVATRAERLALLLRRHAPGPVAAGWRPQRRTLARLAGAIERIDRLKASLYPAQHDRGAPGEGGAGRSRERGEPRPAVEERDIEELDFEELDFEELRREHDRLLAEHGALDPGDVLARASLLLERHADARARLAERFAHVVVDGLELASPACMRLVEVLTAAIGDAVLAGDEDAAARIERWSGDCRTLVLQGSMRCPPALVRAAVAASRGPRAGEAEPERALGAADAEGVLELWRCADDSAQARCVAEDVAGLHARPDAPRVAVFVRSLEREGPAVAGALKERGLVCRVASASAFTARAEVRDLLAWLRLLADPSDPNATVRLLVRPPVALHPSELARVSQLARRGRADMLGAVARAVDSPQLPPEARERMSAFLTLHEEMREAMEHVRPDELVHQLIERAGLLRMRLLEPDAESAESLACLARIERSACHFTRLLPDLGAHELAAFLAAAADAGLPLGAERPDAAALPADAQEGLAPDQLAADPPAVEVLSLAAAGAREVDHAYLLGLSESSLHPRISRILGRAMGAAIGSARVRAVLVHAAADADGGARVPAGAAEAARIACAGEWRERSPGPPGGGTLDAAIRTLARQVVADAASIGGRLGELRLDTDHDIARGVVRYLELVKLCALGERAPGPERVQALADLNARLQSASTPLQRALLEASGLDAALGLDAAGQPAPEGGSGVRAPQRASGDGEELLLSLLPRHGEGLLLSASDIDAYRTCPLRYKFSRLLRLPAEPTPQQRFGIMVHKVLERFHSAPASADASVSARALLRLLDGAWRRAGFGESNRERELYERARAALAAYHRQLSELEGEPLWFERAFAFPVGPHLVRGRVDRVDRLPDGTHELIDYKTGHAKEPAQLAGDVQLSLYALAAEDAWRIGATRQAYYYILDNRRVPLPHGSEAPRERITATIMQAGEGILGLRFPPAPSYPVCASCDYLDVCPAAES